MFFRLFVLFTLVPAVELSLLIYVGRHIGTLNTIAIILLTAVVGAFMVRLEGIGVLYRIQRDLGEGRFPAEELINGVMILVAGGLLLTPGFVTDLMGFLMVIPGSREVIKKMLRRYLERKIQAHRYYY